MSMKKKKNYLDYIPYINRENSWDISEGKVTVHMVHRGFYHWIAQTIFHKPRISHIDLDQYGSFLWQQMDGTRSVRELAEAMHERFGQDAEPLYNRLVKYMQILYNNRFILYK